MMTKEPLARLTWRGPETVARISELLRKSQQITIVLPASYNHALFRVLYPDAPTSATELIDISAGSELLDDIATVDGLEPFGELTAVLRAARATVQLTSPPTMVINLPSADQTSVL